MTSGSILVVGTGLIGTSIGLALRGTRDVLLTDAVPQRLEEAQQRGAGRRWDGLERVDLVVLATPPRAIAAALADLQQGGIGHDYTHVASIQADVQGDLEKTQQDLSHVCGSHPLAGKETSGPAAGAADLFAGRPWLVCPGPTSSAATVDAVRRLALDCGGTPREMTAQEHDRSMALISHLPQLAASAVAARMLDADPDTARLSGPGLQDTTRIAASGPDLWLEVLTGNAAQVAPLTRALGEDLLGVAAALTALSGGEPDGGEVIRDLLVRGNRGRDLIAGKRGGPAEGLTSVLVAIPDSPGALASLFGVAAEAAVNIEDLRLEHLPGRPTGVAELLVADADAPALRAGLSQAGYTIPPASPA